MSIDVKPYTLGFLVYGLPAPQGSKRHVGHGVLVESSSKVKPWREDVKAAAEECAGPDWVPLGGPMQVDVTFYLPRPLSAPKTRRTHAVKMPDLDKLIRSTLDAITAAGVWEDDARVIAINARKVYAHSKALSNAGEMLRPGALITITEVTA